jgi:ureidoglycolate hydrolase
MLNTDKLMSTIEFQADIKKGIIEIPEPHRSEFMSQENVRVIVIKQTQPHQQANLLTYLLDHPLSIDDFIPLRRDEIYDR